MKPVRVTLVPLVVAVAAFFVLLPRTGGDSTIRMEGAVEDAYRFAPDQLSVATQARIRIVNDSDATHTITSIDEAFDLELQPGESGFIAPEGTGSFEFFCRFHGATGGMTGTLTVGDAS
jgi:plastocyanin